MKRHLAAAALTTCIGWTTVRAGELAHTSNWSDSPDRTWVGAEYWANPHQDWQVRDGRLECLRGAPAEGKFAAGRNVHLLTIQPGPRSSFTMQVTLGRMRDRVNGWAGFRFGHHGSINDYRHNCIWGEGIDAGLRTRGELFVGDELVETPFIDSAVLELAVSPDEDGKHIAILTLKNADGIPLKSVRTVLDSAAVSGNLLLVAHGSGKDRDGQFWFKEWQVKAGGEDLRGGLEQAWGPILWTQYTLSHKVMKMTAQMVPLSPQDSRTVELQVNEDAGWKAVATETIDPLSRTATFRIDGWDDSRDTPYRVVYKLKARDGEESEHTWSGTIRRNPKNKAEINVAGFTGNKDFAFPNKAIVNNLKKLDPDVLFFSGDQIYENVARYSVARTPTDIATLDYLRKWYLFGWSFGELLKDRPSVILPDDHDVYQGNIWGAGGRKAPAGINSGGYTMAPEWVNMVQRTQTAHLPDPFNPTPVKQGIGVYYGDMTYGGVSFAILEDRKFKTGPGQVPKEMSLEKASLLGQRQIKFLNEWAGNWKDAYLKAVLSQTVFAQCHTYGGNKKKSLAEDKDANGWPPKARDRAIRAIRKSFALMYAGDNHLPTVAHHGVDEWEDAGVSFTVPSIAAGFPREWRPDLVAHERQGPLPEYLDDLYDGNTPAWIGRYTSSWGHPLTMISVANPTEFTRQGSSLELLDRKSSGFGVVRFNKPKRRYTVECYRILADLDKPAEAQFKGWPVTFEQERMYGRKAKGWLPTLKLSGVDQPVVQVIEEKSGEMLYTLRIRNAPFPPKVFAPGTYTIRIGDGERWLKTFEGVKSGDKGDKVLAVEL